MMEYFHMPPGETVVMGFGDYRILGEGRVTVNGSDYFYVLAEAPVGSACVGAGSLRFIHVRGKVVSWHARADESGYQVSMLEPISDDDVMDAVRTSLKITQPHMQVCF